VDALGLTLKYCLNTHCHADHITGSGEIKKQKPGVQSLIAEASGAKADVQLKHGDTVSMGAVQVRCDRPVGSGVEGWGQGHGRCERLQATGWC
jgi:glyoxylase-like metal-dependent hydrolase (beta-lactamase superfamily II)